MTCPDWNRLAADRRAADGAALDRDPADWREALDHLDGCDDCRTEALDADPLLLFRRLPGIAVDAGTVEDVRAGVAALRRAHRVTGGADPPSEAGVRAATWRGWGRAAAAVVLAAGLLGVQPEVEGPDRETAGLRDATVSPMARMDGPAFAVDDIDHPTASVYHFDDGDLGVVMVVDAGLDV